MGDLNHSQGLASRRCFPEPPPPPQPAPAWIRISASLGVRGLFCPVPGRNVRGGMGSGPRRKAALWAKGEPLGGRGRVYPGPGVWLGMAPLSAAGCLGLCWPPDVRWLQPAGPPPHAQRGFIKSGCEEAREAAWLQPAGSAPHPAAAARAQVSSSPPHRTDDAPTCLVGDRRWGCGVGGDRWAPSFWARRSPPLSGWMGLARVLLHSSVSG